MLIKTQKYSITLWEFQVLQIDESSEILIDNLNLF